MTASLLSNASSLKPLVQKIPSENLYTLKISVGVLGRSIYSLEYEGNKASDKRLELYSKTEEK